MIERFYTLLTEVSTFSVFIPITAGAIARRHLNSTLWVLTVYLCVCLLADLLGLLFADNDPVQCRIGNTFTLTECILICSIYFIEYRSSRIKYLVILSLAVVVSSAFIQFYIHDKFAVLDTKVSTLSAALIVVLSGISIVRFVMSSALRRVETNYFFWIVISNLFYFATALVFFMAGSFIKKSPDHVADALWAIHNTINIGCYILFAVGICQIQRK